MSEGAKNIHLRTPMPKEKFVAKLAATLQAGGQVEAPPAGPKIGDKMPDGTIYVGLSPETNKPMYAMPVDAPLTMKFNQAEKYAAKLDAHGHHDWRLPTKAELNVLFNNRASIGGFNTSGPGTATWYWSSSPGNNWEAQRFSDGCQDDPSMEDGRSSLRCVR
jgi:hypothetical protein